MRDLFGDRVSDLTVSQHVLDVRGFTDPDQLRAHYKQYFGPTIATYEAIKDDPDRTEALDRDFAEFLAGKNLGDAGGPARFEYEYVRIVARVRAEA